MRPNPQLLNALDIAFVQDRLGHANIQNTMVYMRYTTVTRDTQTRQLFASHSHSLNRPPWYQIP